MRKVVDAIVDMWLSIRDAVEELALPITCVIVIIALMIWGTK